MLNTIVEALRSGSVSRLFDSMVDQFNQLVGRIGRMYSDGVEREVYVVEQSPKIDKRERQVLNQLVTKMRLTQSNIEDLSKENETELNILEEKINSIKTNLNEIWDNLKNMYSDHNMKATNVSYFLERLDFIDPKQIRMTASELQTQLNKLWRDLSRNLMQTVDRVDLNLKRLTKQTLLRSNQRNDDIDIVRKKVNGTDQLIERERTEELEKANLKVQDSSADLQTETFDPIKSSRKLERLNRLSKLIEPVNSHSNLLSNNVNMSYLINSSLNKDKIPLTRYLRNVDRLQAESEKVLNNDLKKLINHRSKLAKLQMTNDTNDDEDDANSSTGSSNEPNDSNSSSSSGSSSSSEDDLKPGELDFENESQLKRFTNMLRNQFNQSLTQFTNYWRSIGAKINEHRKNFNQTNAGRKLNFDPFGFRNKDKDLDQDAFYSPNDEHFDESDFISSYYSHNC